MEMLEWKFKVEDALDIDIQRVCDDASEAGLNIVLLTAGGRSALLLVAESFLRTIGSEPGVSLGGQSVQPYWGFEGVGVLRSRGGASFFTEMVRGENSTDLQGWRARQVSVETIPQIAQQARDLLKMGKSIVVKVYSF